ncbi:MAG TPA: hypothetical protein VF053_09990 [Streptosporangiales bacterium]
MATINALAFGTSSMRLRASGNVLTGLFHAMTRAQQRLTDAEREAERSGLSLDDDGIVREPATSAVPTGPRGGRAVTPVSGDVDRLQRKVDGIVLFATAADALAKSQLTSYTKPLITTQTADRDLLKRAREDNGAAAKDLLGSVNVEDRLTKAEPRALPPGHTLATIRRYFVAYTPAALDALAMFAGTWLEAEGLADLAVGTTGGVLSAPETAGIGALVGAGIDLVGVGAVYVGQGIAGWGDQRLPGDLATARAETRGTDSSAGPPRRGEVTCKDGVKRVYEPNSGKRGHERRGRISPEPTDPLGSLKDSIRVKPTSDARVAVDPKSGEYVVFRRENHEEPPIYHGYSVPWNGGTHNDALSQDMKNALIKAGLVDSKGRILGR